MVSALIETERGIERRGECVAFLLFIATYELEVVNKKVCDLTVYCPFLHLIPFHFTFRC